MSNRSPEAGPWPRTEALAQQVTDEVLGRGLGGVLAVGQMGQPNLGSHSTAERTESTESDEVPRWSSRCSP